MRESEIISGVVDLLSKPESWVKEIRARDAAGCALAPPSARAVSFCLGGAVMQVTESEYWDGWWAYTEDAVGRRFHRLARNRGYENMHPCVTFNNDPDTTREDIMLFLKEALFDAQAEEATAKIEANLAAIEAADA